MNKQTGSGSPPPRFSEYCSLNTVRSAILCLLSAGLLAAFAPQAQAVEATGGTVTNYTSGGTNWTQHIFTNAGVAAIFHTGAAGGTVELLVVAGGGSGGGSQFHGAGGGAGGLIFSNAYTVTHNTDYGVFVGDGGAALPANSTLQGNNGQNSTFGPLPPAIGGGGGGEYQSLGKSGGSGGGGARDGTAGGSGTSGQGHAGGAGFSSGSFGSGGGGGAGTNGVDGTSTTGGDGGTGVYVSAFADWGDTNNPGWFAGGGGGGTLGGTAGTGGKGGGGDGSATGSGIDAQPNTGGGGGGPESHDTLAASGAGGSGIVIVRYVTLPPVMIGASGGDILYPTNLNGTVHYVHIFTNIVGTNYFTPTRALNVEFLVIGGGGGGGGGRAGGGGAGGYRCSVPGELSGSNSTAEAVYAVAVGVAYPVVVGAGGAGGASTVTGNKGGDSWFTNIVSIGGGGGKERNLGTGNPNGGSGGGGGYLDNTEPQPGGSGTASQGFKGGDAVGNADGFKASYGGGGGGAGSPGTDGFLISDPWGSGGTGLVSSITGAEVKRAGGGGGGQVTWGVATNYGGGVDVAGRRDGAASTGGGGGASWSSTSGNGGSGVVIVRYAVPAITASDTSLDFGDTPVNTTGTLTYAVSGAKLAGDMTITAPTPEFTIATNGGTFGAQVVLTPASGSVPSTTITVHFVPTAIQAYSGTITNASAGADDKLVSLTGNGVSASVPLLTVTPASLDLGNVITNKTSTNQMFTVMGVNLTNNVTVTAPSASFAVSTNGLDFSPSVALTTNASGSIDITNIYVRFTPSAGSGPYAGSITNSSAGALDRMVTVTGAGIVQTLDVSAASLNFGNVAKDTTSNLTYTVSGFNLDANVTLTVPGSTGFLIKTNGGASFGTSVTLSVPNQSQPEGGALSARTIVVQFAPTAAQAYGTTITAASVGAVSQATTLSGNGVVQQIGVQQPAGTALTDGVSSIDFATAGLVKTFVVTNSGVIALTLTGITKDGHSSDFTVGGTLPASLAAGASTNFTVTFTPTANGARSAGLHVVNGTPDGSFDITLTGTASAGDFLAFGGDVLTVITNYTGTPTQAVYGVHQFTNVGIAYFSPLQNLDVEYLVIGGGGSGGPNRGGGGGAGGYRCSVPGELSGSNTTAEAVYPVSANVAYPVVVGTGGVVGPTTGGTGGDSWFTNIVSTGGGGGKERDSAIPEPNANGGSGGGGGFDWSASDRNIGGSGTVGQGFPGGNAGGTGHGFAFSDAGGGGGAGGAGENGSNSDTQDSGGGAGLESSITGVAVKRAGGGQGAYPVGTSPGKAYGGGDQSGVDGAASTGGGGSRVDGGATGTGGSGVVILRYVIPPTSSPGTLFLIR